MYVCENQLLWLPPVRPLGERLGAEFFRAVPECPGVYLLCGRGDGVLYVGKARNLRRRLAAYRSANPDRWPRKLGRLLAAVERIHWDECATEAAALERESELLRTLQPRFNTAGVFPAPAEWIGWRVGEDGVSFEWSRGAGGAGQLGPVSQLRPAYGAILRIAWRVAHPGVCWFAMPRRLLSVRPPSWWHWPSAGVEARVEAFLAWLNGWLSSTVDGFPTWLMEATAASAGFERNALEHDVELLRDAVERWARRGVPRPT